MYTVNTVADLRSFSPRCTAQRPNSGRWKRMDKKKKQWDHKLAYKILLNTFDIPSWSVSDAFSQSEWPRLSLRKLDQCVLIAAKGSEYQSHTVMIAMALIRSKKVVGHAEKLAFQRSRQASPYPAMCHNDRVPFFTWCLLTLYSKHIHTTNSNHCVLHSVSLACLSSPVGWVCKSLDQFHNLH